MLAKSKAMLRKLRRGGLCLKRKPGEEIVVDLPHGGEVVFVMGRDGRVRVIAPADCRITRGELVDQAHAA